MSSKEINSLICPTCGKPNECAQEVARATGKPSEACWCMSATFSAELLDRVPEEVQNKACICEKCVSSSIG